MYLPIFILSPFAKMHRILIILQGRYYYIDKKTEAQRSYTTCPRVIYLVSNEV